MKQIIGISLQDKYGLGGTKPSDYVYMFMIKMVMLKGTQKEFQLRE